MTDKCRKPCVECPFSRKGPAGDTGGADPSVFIGQAMGPFFLPCHMDPDYERNRRSTLLLQCAGAAMFRSNIGVDPLMPSFLLHLPENEELAFSSAEELLAHHRKISLEAAEAELVKLSPKDLFHIEMSKIGVQILKPNGEE